jgi:hypothetical protein
VAVDGETVTLIAVPAIFEQFAQAGKKPGRTVAQELLEQIQIYNPVPAGQEEAYRAVLLQAYRAFCTDQEETER